MPAPLNASRRCWMADREIGVPGGRIAAKSAGKSACATKCSRAHGSAPVRSRRLGRPQFPPSAFVAASGVDLGGVESPKLGVFHRSAAFRGLLFFAALALRGRGSGAAPARLTIAYKEIGG